jgi:hypothetical protein
MIALILLYLVVGFVLPIVTDRWLDWFSDYDDDQNLAVVFFSMIGWPLFVVIFGGFWVFGILTILARRTAKRLNP